MIKIIQCEKKHFHFLRREYFAFLKKVMESDKGWVDGVEPYLQMRAVVEYENDDLWLDIRHMLKPYVKGLPLEDE